jgi:hypothetical protein
VIGAGTAVGPGAGLDAVVVVIGIGDDGAGVVPGLAVAGGIIGVGRDQGVGGLTLGVDGVVVDFLEAVCSKSLFACQHSLLTFNSHR